MSWFYDLFGFEEEEYIETKSKFRLSKNKKILHSVINGEKYICGTFSTPTLGELKICAGKHDLIRGQPIVKHITTMDIMREHNRSKNKSSTFQVASQFNCLEFPSSRCTPEMGITTYEYDSTQGPACSLAAAAATVYRNYFTKQTKYNQIDNSKDMHEYIRSIEKGDTHDSYWTVQNGYTNSTSHKLKNLKRLLKRKKIIKDNMGRISESAREKAISNLRVGLHSGVGVVLKRRYGCLERCKKYNKVTQVFCSAVSCSYGDRSIDNNEWEPLARLVLDGSYEATLWAAAIEYSLGIGNGKVFLTMLGGDAFGNEPEWISDSISRSINKLKSSRVSLEVNIVHFQTVDTKMRDMINDKLN